MRTDELPSRSGGSGVRVAAAPFVMIIASILGLAVLGLWHQSLIENSLRVLCLISAFVFMTWVTLAARLTSLGLWSAPALYLTVLGLFHFGLTMLYGLGLHDGRTEDLSLSWFFDPLAKEAIFVSMLAFIAAGLGIGVSQLTHHGRRSTESPQLANASAIESMALRLNMTNAGTLLIALGVSLWITIVVLSGGVSLMFGSYVDYLGATQRFPVISYVWLSIGFGLCLLASGNRSRIRKVGIGIFTAWAVVAIPLGLRGEVLFCSMAAMVVLARRAKAPPLRSSLIFGFALLFLISAAREVRTVGIGNLEHIGGGSVVDGLAELGASLRPVFVVIEWHAEGDTMINGASYWAPLDRLLCRVVDPMTCVPGLEDERVMNALVIQRVGPIGFSPVAEAYRNGGALAIVGVFTVIGIIVGTLGRIRSGPKQDAFIGVILVVLLTNVRNDFISVPFHLFVGFGVIQLISVLSGAPTSRHILVKGDQASQANGAESAR